MNKRIITEKFYMQKKAAKSDVSPHLRYNLKIFGTVLCKLKQSGEIGNSGVGTELVFLVMHSILNHKIRQNKVHD